MDANFRHHAAGSGLSTPIRVSEAELMLVLWQIDTAIESGASVTLALNRILERPETESTSVLAARLSDNISSGIPISLALGRNLQGCSKLVYAITMMGESTGRLDLAISVLLHMHDLHIRWRSSFDSWIVTSPRLFAGLWGLILLFAAYTSHVQAQTLFVEQQTSFISRAVRFMAAWGCDPLVWLLTGLLLIWYLLWRRRGGVGFCRLARNAWRRLPWIGKVVENRLAARSMRLLAFLLEAGQSTHVAASVIAEHADQADVQHVFRSSCEILRNGGALSQAFSMSGLLPERVIRTIATGEELGTLPETVAWLAESYEAEVSRESEAVGALFTAGMVLAQICLALALFWFGFNSVLLLAY